jgi:hexosaminidase
LEQIFSLALAQSDKGILVENFTLTDYPRYDWRGFMLDESRHFFGADEVMALLDKMHALKLNKFHWHLSNDQGYRVESKAFPRINEVSSTRSDTQIGGWHSTNLRGVEHSGLYTHEDIQKVVAYANGLGIEIIPELSVPGHVSAIVSAYNELSCTGEISPVPHTFGRKNTIICAGGVLTWHFLESLISEWAALFPSKYFHLGGNHARLDYWKNCAKCKEFMQENQLETIQELEAFFMNRLAGHLTSLGKTPILRSDMLSEKSCPQILGDYYLKLNNNKFTGFLAGGGKYFSTRHKAYYLDHPYSLTSLQLSYNYTPDTDDTSQNTGAQLVGVEGVLFTEWIYDREKIEFSIFPRLIAIAETAWSQNHNRNYKDFLRRLKHFNRTLRAKNISFAKLRIAGAKNPFKRLKNLTTWFFFDQYSEVRDNRNDY